MNVLNKEAVATIRQLARAGFSRREIRKITGFHWDTIRNYVQDIRINLNCTCGRPIAHRGWCSDRVSRSAARRAFLTQWGQGAKAGHKSYCRVCGRLHSGQSRACDCCEILLSSEASYRVEYKAFRKQMAEMGQLLTQAKKVIHENNE